MRRKREMDDEKQLRTVFFNECLLDVCLSFRSDRVSPTRFLHGNRNGRNDVARLFFQRIAGPHPQLRDGVLRRLRVHDISTFRFNRSLRRSTDGTARKRNRHTVSFATF